MKIRYLLAFLALVSIAACNPDDDTVYQSSNDLKVKLVPVKPYTERVISLPDGSVLATCKKPGTWDFYLAKIHPDGTVDSVDYSFLNSNHDDAYEVEGSVKVNTDGDIFVDNSRSRDGNRYHLLKFDADLRLVYDISGELSTPDHSIVAEFTFVNGEFGFLTKCFSWDDYTQYVSIFMVSADGFVGDEIVLSCFTGEESFYNVYSVGSEIMLSYTNDYSSVDMCTIDLNNVSHYEIMPLKKNFEIYSCNSQGDFLGFATAFATSGYYYYIGTMKRDGSMVLSDSITGNNIFSLYESAPDLFAVGYRAYYSTNGIDDTKYDGFIYDIDINTGAIKDSVIMDYYVKPLALTSDGRGGYNLYLERMFKYVNNANQYDPTLDNLYIYNISDLHQLQLSDQ